MIFGRGYFVATTHQHNWTNPAQQLLPLTVTLLNCVALIIMLIFGCCSTRIHRPFVTTWAWTPQRFSKRSHHRFTLLRGGDVRDPIHNPKHQQWDTATISDPFRRYSTPSSTASAELEEKKKTTDDVVTETTNLASSICGGDDFSYSACSYFGGLRYYNTDVDNRFRVLFVLGGPGSGKGTQSSLMEQNYPVAHFSVGELLRNVPDHSPHKATIDAKLVAGQIVPVEISLSLLRAAMEATPSKHTLFLVDGFPRNFDNLSGWCRVMSQVAALESVLVYQCPFPVLQERILERAKISGRSDDNIDSVKKRFKTFESETLPVVGILRSVSQNCPLERQRWSVVDIAGDRALEDVWTSTQQTLNNLIQSDVLSANAALLTSIQMHDAKTYEQLCDPLFFQDADVATVMRQQEGEIGAGEVQQAEIEIISGRQVSVSYDILLDGICMREKRFWSHQGIHGWRNVHFVRKPVEIDPFVDIMKKT